MIWDQGRRLYRDMPWRSDTRPYYVLVSELMLQQTQVARVIPKFKEFIARFPDEQVLSDASLSDVLTAWQGLGYNRRAKFLQQAAIMICTEFNGEFPTSRADILRLPGVGKNTAGAIEAYAFNRPSIFIETNVRTVYIHHFFAGMNDVSDADIQAILEQTIDHEHPREFYWALMDYGAWLKASGVRNVARSRHYKKQSPLAGSVREVRGLIIRQLATSEKMSIDELKSTMPDDDRFNTALDGLAADGLIAVDRQSVWLTK